MATVKPKMRIVAPRAPSAPRVGALTPQGSGGFAAPTTPKPAQAQTGPSQTTNSILGNQAGPSQTATGVDPRDAVYWAEKAKLDFQVKQQLGDLDLQGQRSSTDYNEMLRRRVEQAGNDKSSITKGSNREGLLFSGQLAKRQGDYDVGYSRELSDAELSFTRGNDDRETQRKRLGEQQTIDWQSLFSGAGDRYAANLAANPPAPQGPNGEPVVVGAQGQMVPQSQIDAATKQMKMGGAMDRAKALMREGRKTGPAWAEVIGILGYDPRQGGKLVFR